MNDVVELAARLEKSTERLKQFAESPPYRKHDHESLRTLLDRALEAGDPEARSFVEGVAMRGKEGQA